ncbi:hypothetical protein Ocin01_02996 [Orchesella cincta]|uniref:Uncharacterized protein n=1 Tax=Orchesella cincta TaxID=48709 RepID=A0A1D2NEL2_ORCCI|nr:hypothetical protein Ocin01_02996 [Orchesella cincta]
MKFLKFLSFFLIIMIGIGGSLADVTGNNEYYNPQQANGRQPKHHAPDTVNAAVNLVSVEVSVSASVLDSVIDDGALKQRKRILELSTNQLTYE